MAASVSHVSVVALLYDKEDGSALIPALEELEHREGLQFKAVLMGAAEKNAHKLGISPENILFLNRVEGFGSVVDVKGWERESSFIR